MAKPNPKIWEDGIRFQCQGTGRCCVSRNGYGYVYLNIGDRRRLAGHLGIATSAFTRKFCENTDGHFHLKGYTGPCQFLVGKGCSVYEARPNQCRTWPFWPENMNSKTWDTEVKAYCPGVGKGRVWSREEIDAELALDPVAPYKPVARKTGSVRETGPVRKVGPVSER